MKVLDQLREIWDEMGAIVVVILLLVGVVAAVAWFAKSEGVKAPSPPHTYTAEAFTTDLTITIQCSGDCDLAAMIAEAREAAEK